VPASRRVRCEFPSKSSNEPDEAANEGLPPRSSARDVERCNSFYKDKHRVVRGYNEYGAGHEARMNSRLEHVVL